MKSFYSHGKLLLTGEYVVLDGANALAIPTIYGQTLIVESATNNRLKWVSYNESNAVWFETEIDLQLNEILKSTSEDASISERLLQILKAAKHLNPEFLNNSTGYSITTELGFPKNWGLGTSSTLINNIASWAKIDSYALLESTFGGSGYDIACAKAERSLTYQLRKLNNKILNQAQDDTVRDIKPVSFNPDFKEHIYFVHLNQKQNSREGIAQYRANTLDKTSTISRISAISKDMISCESIHDFEDLMNEHEQLISEIINQTPVKQRLFSDFKGSIKSLGAWGGDFVMVASKDNPTSYFNLKGYGTILGYSEMVKN